MPLNDVNVAFLPLVYFFLFFLSFLDLPAFAAGFSAFANEPFDLALPPDLPAFAGAAGASTVSAAAATAVDLRTGVERGAGAPLPPTAVRNAVPGRNAGTVV